MPQIEIPKFNADSTYSLTEKIVAMSPRVTGSEGAKKVKNWLIAQFKRFGVETIEQNFTATVYTGAKLPATNIIARINPQATLRILLSAHWDSRPFADKDSDSTQQNRPILGADDSASSVAMLLELARQLQATPLSNVGFDIVLFDA
ncbi:MAG: M28 family peptidase, partial [Saprospiraceae bacterium]|nr:M28 family peptidase [Saprospiraceae bacterium]